MNHPRNRFRNSGRHGFSLIEATIATVIVSMMLMSALYMAGSAARARQSLARRAVGPQVADDYLNEILQLYYEDPDGSPSWGEEQGEMSQPEFTRTLYDDIDDFVFHTEPFPRTKDGTPIPEFAGWTRHATIQRVLVTAPNVTSPVDTGLLKITVTATSDDGQIIQRDALRSRNSTFDAHPTTDTEYVVQTRIKLRIGEESGNARVGSVTHLNRVPAN